MPDLRLTDKKEAAKILRRVGMLLQLAGENDFKARAYDTGARAVESFDGDMAELVDAVQADQVKGIGKSLAEKVTELATTGELQYLAELEQSLPEGLPELLRIEGLGPKKIRRLYEELSIESVAELEYACQENRLVELKGFGKKSQEKILTGIEHMKKFVGRFHLHLGRNTSIKLRERIESSGLASHIEVCGSLRRGKETVKDVDLLAVSDKPMELMKLFVEGEDIADIIAHGDTKSSVRLRSGIAVDLRVLPAESYPAAVVYFTGSAEHNTHLRGIARKQGMKLNEYGLYRGDELIPCETEQDIYRHIGLTFVPPPLREDMGEIELAQKGGEFPKLVQAEDITGVVHCHTTYSDGTNTVAQLAEHCKKRGYRYLAISDHSKTAAYAGGLKEDDLIRQRGEIDDWNQANPDCTVFAGIESDILPDGSLDYPDTVLAGLDFVIASVHSSFTMPEDQMTARVLRAVENRHTRILGHPTGRLLLGRDGYKLDMEKIIDACAANNTSIELNANPYRLDIDWRLIARAVKKGVTISINPDAHSEKHLDFIALGVMMAQKGWCEAKHILNTGPADRFREFCREGR